MATTPPWDLFYDTNVLYLFSGIIYYRVFVQGHRLEQSSLVDNEVASPMEEVLLKI